MSCHNSFAVILCLYVYVTIPLPCHNSFATIPLPCHNSFAALSQFSFATIPFPCHKYLCPNSFTLSQFLCLVKIPLPQFLCLVIISLPQFLCIVTIPLLPCHNFFLPRPLCRHSFVSMYIIIPLPQFYCHNSFATFRPFSFCMSAQCLSILKLKENTVSSHPIPFLHTKLIQVSRDTIFMHADG